MIASLLLSVLLAAGSYWSIAPDGSVIEVLPPRRIADRNAEGSHGTPAVTKHKSSRAIHFMSRRDDRRRRRR